MKPAKLSKPFRNRIVGHGEEAVDQLLANPKNFRLHPDNQQQALAGAIDDIGFIRSVTVNRVTGCVVDGHLRVTLAMRSGIESLPVEYVELTEAEEAEALMMLDPIAAMAATDKQKLDELMRQVRSDDARVQQMMTDLAEREKLEYGKPPAGDDPGAQVDKAEELRQKWGVELGQLWQLGEHRLICGDCTDRAVVDRVMQGEKADLCVTDPPYGVNYDPEWRGEDLKQTVHGKKIANDDNFDWLKSFEYIPADVLYVWLASYWLATVQFGIEKYGFITKYLIIWNKDLAVFGRGNYHWKHEPCLYMVRDGANMNWQGARDQSTVWDIPTIHSFKNGHNSEEWGLVGHGNQKPLECMERPIRNNSAPGQIVIDIFSGSGTTLIACERLGRKCRAVEISPAYCAVTLERWATMTGKTPVLIGTK